jgi:molecular chaperone HtpG
LTISGDNLESLKGSPQLEQARAKDVEVLLLTDAIDDFWLPMAGTFEDKPFKSLTRDAVDLSKIGEADTAEEEKAEDDPALDRLVAHMKVTLGDAVKDVRRSKRLTDSAVCLVADAGGFDLHLERFLKQHKQIEGLGARVLEVNPKHPLVRAMANALGEGETPAAVDELVRLLLDQARVVEGEPLPDPGAFSRRMSKLLQANLPPAA